MKIIEFIISKIEIVILLFIFLFSSYLSYSLLQNNISFISSQFIIIEKPILYNFETYINKDWSEKKADINIDTDIINDNKIIEKDNWIHNILEDYYSLSFKNKTFLLSNDEKSYEYWFITKEIKNNVLYLYSHNSYKYTENSWYFLYNELEKNSIIEFNNIAKYKIISIDEVNFDNETINEIKLKEWVNIVYFTCTPLGWDIRKVYQLKKV